MALLWARRIPCLVVAICILGSLSLPAPVKAENIGRTLGGAAGIAAGSMAGFGIASAVIKAAGVAAMAPMVKLMIGTAIVGAAAWGGAKLFSHLGLALDRAMGPKAVWMMLGATIGTVAAVSLIPTVGIFAGPVGLIAKGLIGGLAGGTLLGLLHKPLEAVATPRVLYAAAGGTIGAVAGGVPGALAGAAGGLAIGAVMDQGFFADEDFYPGRAMRDRWDDVREHFRYCRDDVEDWRYDRRDRFAQRYDQRPYRYDDCDESFYWQNDFYDDEDDEEYQAHRRPGRRGKGHAYGHQRRRGNDHLFELKTKWQEAMAEFEEFNLQPDTSPRDLQRSLKKVRRLEAEYQEALRECEGY
jgi:hypothetical protein